MNMPESDPLSILEMPAARAETFFNRLSLADQASLVMMTPWERRQELLLMSSNAKTLVQGMPVEELFWTIKAAGPQDALSMLEMAAPEQLQFIFDLDWWRKDELAPEKILMWLILLFEAKEGLRQGWLRWLARRDESLLAAVLRPFIRIIKRPDDMDIQEARDTLPAFTLDDVYFIAFKKDEFAPAVSRLLGEIMTVSDGLYRDTAEAVLWTTGAEDLENAFRLRNARLSGFGIPDYYDALDIYASLPANRVRRVEKTLYKKKNTDELMPAFIPTLYMGEYPTLHNAVNGLAGTPEMERVVLEWVGAANKVLMAGATDLDDPVAMKQALLRTAASMNLAIEALMDEECKGASDILDGSILEDLVRLSNSITRGLKSRVLAIMDAGIVSKEFLHLPDPWEGLLEGLLASPRPRLWDDSTGDYVEFSSLAQVTWTNGRLDEIEAWGRLMAEIPPHWAAWAETFSFTHTNLKQYMELTWPQALLTALAQERLSGELIIKAVKESDLARLRRIWFPAEGGLLPRQTVDECISALKTQALEADVEETSLRRMTARVLNDFYEEIRGLPMDVPIDGRFITAMLIKLEPGR